MKIQLLTINRYWCTKIIREWRENPETEIELKRCKKISLKLSRFLIDCMKTYLILWHSSEGENPRLVMQRLTGLGFKPITGHYDLEYDYGRRVTLEDIMALSVKVHETLRGSGVLYKLETVNLEED
ncbi:MAG: hypothetical protein ACFFCQ_08730 [Promethearchaeota archaeon]